MKQYSLFEDQDPVKGIKETAAVQDNQSGEAAPDDDKRPISSYPAPPSEISFDIEATGPDPMKDTIVGISLCRETGKACYVPVRHTQGPNLESALEIVRPVLEDEAIKKIGHNLKYDMLILRREGVEVRGTLYDTMVAAYLLNPNRSDHSLENTGLEYLQYGKRPFREVLGKRTSFAEVPHAEAADYAAEDAALAMELKGILFERLKDDGLEDLYFRTEMPLIYVLADMEEAGVKINRARLGELSKELESEMSAMEAGIYEFAGERFNINSPKQLAKILFEKLGLKPGKKTKTGFSTGVDVLEDLAKVHELPLKILNYRTLNKLKTTYTDSLPKLINPKTGRVHTSFNQTVTATGRLSSSEPNLQNIPVRGEWGTKIREVFIAEEGNVLLSADYSQVELRILAHISGDAGLLEAFRSDMDVHTGTAAGIFGVSPEEVTTDMRRIAKTVNFGVVYGISPYGLSEAISITPKEAGQYIDCYFEKHPGVKVYMDNIITFARQKGYVATLLGRKRRIPEIRSPNSNSRLQAERFAINTPIQGSAADLIKTAMINLAGRLRAQGMKSRIVLQIHDELLLESPSHELKEVAVMLRHEMENAMQLSVPLSVDIGWGANWAEAH